MPLHLAASASPRTLDGPRRSAADAGLLRIAQLLGLKVVDASGRAIGVGRTVLRALPLLLPSVLTRGPGQVGGLAASPFLTGGVGVVTFGFWAGRSCRPGWPSPRRPQALRPGADHRGSCGPRRGYPSGPSLREVGGSSEAQCRRGGRTGDDRVSSLKEGYGAGPGEKCVAWLGRWTRRCCQTRNSNAS